MMEREWYEGKANKVAAVHKGNLAMFPNVHNWNLVRFSNEKKPSHSQVPKCSRGKPS